MAADLDAEHIWRTLIAPNIEAARQCTLHRLSRPLAATDYARMRARFLAGHLEHGGDILTWPKMRFAAEAQEERDDALIYCGAELGLFP